MEPIDFFIPSGEKNKICLSIYLSPFRAKSCIVFAPGALQYPGMYEEFIGKFAEDYDVIGVHYVGHGKSISDNGYVMDDLIRNVEDAVIWASGRYKKIILLGYSLGGIIALKLAVRNLPLNGIIAYGIIIPEQEETFKELIKIPLIENREKFLKVVDFFDGKLPKRFKFPEWLFRNGRGKKETIKKLLDDPLATKFYRKEFLFSALRVSLKEVTEQGINFPFVAVASKGDGLIPYAYQFEMFKKIKAKDKKFLSLDLPKTHLPLQEYPDQTASEILPLCRDMLE